MRHDFLRAVAPQYAIVALVFSFAPTSHTAWVHHWTIVHHSDNIQYM